MDLTKYGSGKFFAKVPNTSQIKDEANKASTRLDTFYKTFQVGENSYSDVLNNIFNNKTIPSSQKTVKIGETKPSIASLLLIQ